ncbi:MAG: DUF1428 domain-containing protein [Candidatus Marsarchaeota archaeon]|nr:DUF1428 domain-containing protein [Candidatus Marsarchaeota archaeon]
MAYVDGFVLVVAKKNLKAYREMARQGGRAWKKHGALEYFECVGDDLHPDMGGMKGRPFPELAKVRKGETVVFSFIVFKSKASRNRVNAKVMKDPSMSPEAWKDKPMPFDIRRVSYGGFKAMVEM